MKWIVVALACLVPWGPGSASAQSLFSSTQDPIAGARVFGAKGCAKCHAVNGVGGGVGPDLGRIPQPRSFYELAAAIWNHLPAMGERMRQRGIQQPHLDQRQTGDLIAFLYTLNYFDPVGDLKAGQALFVEKKCVLCHQAGGVGGVVGPNLDVLAQFASAISLAAAMWNHGPAMAEAMRARGIERPTFKASELRDLMGYLKSATAAPAEGALYLLPGRVEEGRRLFRDKRCAECHGAGGQGGRLGPDLAERGRQMSLTEFAAAMWNKEPAMVQAMKAQGVAVPQLGADETADLLAYLYAIEYLASTGDAKKGPERLRARGCLRCHALSGRGGKVGPDLARLKGLHAPTAVLAALWNHGFAMAERAERERVAWPRLTAEEMADVVALLQSLSRTR